MSVKIMKGKQPELRILTSYEEWCLRNNVPFLKASENLYLLKNTKMIQVGPKELWQFLNGKTSTPDFSINHEGDIVVCRFRNGNLDLTVDEYTEIVYGK